MHVDQVLTTVLCLCRVLKQVFETHVIRRRHQLKEVCGLLIRSNSIIFQCLVIRFEVKIP